MNATETKEQEAPAVVKILHRYTGEVIREVPGSSLAGANLSDANLSRADLSGADLSGAYLSRADLSGADLSDANLSRADLSDADLSGADLSGANLSRANLSRAYLSGADLSGANLSDANLSRADLSGADLSGAYLSGADLSGATLPEGVSWEVYCTEVLPTLLVAGGQTLQSFRASGALECHDWNNCLMAHGFGVHSLQGIPAFYRPWADRTIQLFDAHLLDGVLQELIPDGEAVAE